MRRQRQGGERRPSRLDDPCRSSSASRSSPAWTRTCSRKRHRAAAARPGCRARTNGEIRGTDRASSLLRTKSRPFGRRAEQISRLSRPESEARRRAATRTTYGRWDPPRHSRGCELPGSRPSHHRRAGPTGGCATKSSRKLKAGVGSPAEAGRFVLHPGLQTHNWVGVQLLRREHEVPAAGFARSKRRSSRYRAGSLRLRSRPSSIGGNPQAHQLVLPFALPRRSPRLRCINHVAVPGRSACPSMVTRVVVHHIQVGVLLQYRLR